MPYSPIDTTPIPPGAAPNQPSYVVLGGELGGSTSSVRVSTTATGSTTARSLADRAADLAWGPDLPLYLDGATDDRARLVAGLALLGSANKTLVLPGKVYLSSGATITIPDNLPVRFEGGSSGFVGPGAGQVVFRTHDGVFNVRRDFNARGDGVTDDTAAIQAALTATPDGSTVIFPAGTYLVVPAISVQYHDKGAPNGVRKTAFHLVGRKDLVLLGRGTVNIVVGGVDAERVAFFFDGCTNVRLEGLGFNLLDTSTAGAAQLPSQDFYPIALEGTVDLTVTRCKFVASRTAIFMDAFNGGANANVRVDGCTFKNTVHYSLLSRNADGVAFVNNRCFGTGRSWNTSNEDVALSDNTTNSVVSANQFINPIGTVSRVTTVLNLGPTSIAGNVKNGGGIFVEIYEASNVSISGNTSINNMGTSEHILFTSNTNTNNEHVTVSGNTFVNGGIVISDFFAGTNTKDGLIFSNNICSGTYGPQTSSARTGVIYQGNRFNLANAGQEIRSSGQGLIFVGNHIYNGYLSLLDNNGARVQGNYFLGNFGTPIAVALNISGTVAHDVRGNRFEPSSYVAFWSQTPALPIGFTYLDKGLSQSPATAMPTKITGAVGDTVENDTPTVGQPKRWRCTSAGTPGTWVSEGNL